MAYYNWDDCTLTYNSQTLTTFVRSISGVKMNAQMMDFHPLGVAWPTPIDTGLRSHDPIVVEFLYDGVATSGPAAAAAVGTSATFTLVQGTNQSIAGTAVVTDAEFGISADGSHTYTATFTPSGTWTWDVIAAA